MRKIGRVAVLALALGVSACDGDSDPRGSRTSAVRGVPPIPASGPSCAGIHGDPPRPLTSSLISVFDLIPQLLQACVLSGGELLEWTDPNGTPRGACVRVPASASPDEPLPLLVFLQASLYPAESQTFVNLFDFLPPSGDLSGDPDRQGFILLVPYGRDTAHFYPFPDDTGLGWDNWYRNFDRDDPSINVDVATIDHFIDEVRARDLVDERRIYLSGWSNGAAMAILYALNTPGIAATAVYSNPDPFRDIGDPCAQPPFGNNFRPILHVLNDCDVAGICQTGGEEFAAEMASVMPEVELDTAIIDLFQQRTSRGCDALCAYDGNPLQLLTPGAARHSTWPYLWTEQMFAFLREHPL